MDSSFWQSPHLSDSSTGFNTSVGFSGISPNATLLGSGLLFNKPLAEMTDEELAQKGYKRYLDGSIRDRLGHFAGNSGVIPGTPGVDAAEAYLCSNGYTIIAREISVRVEVEIEGHVKSVIRRYDLVVTSSDGEVIGVEVKSGSAIRTPQQRLADGVVKNRGADAVGEKAERAGIKRIDKVCLIKVNTNRNVTEFNIL